jgi:hypothetical protein
VTAYAYGAVVTHVMEWNDHHHDWRSLCDRRQPINPRDYVGDWPLEHVLTRRRLPFCRLCVRTIDRRVTRLTTEILVPARAEGTLSWIPA